MSDIKTVKDLLPDSHNANKGTPRGLKMVEASLQEDGFGRPVLIDKNGKLIAGNKTVESVAQTFGIDTEVVLVKTTGNKVIVHQREDLDLDDLQGSARRLAYRDNLSSHFSFELEPEVVLADWEAGFDFDGIGLKVEDLATLLPEVTEFGANGNAGEDTEPQIDNIDELQKKWQIKAGDLWVCNKNSTHYLMCGDSSEMKYVSNLLTADIPTNLFYDPFWNVAVDLAIPGVGMNWKNILAFTDGNRSSDVIKKFGSPAWIFTWDGVTSWYTPNRPLKRAKYAFWYGDINSFNFNGAHYGDPGEAKTVKNTRGEYSFIPDPRGKHLSDVFQLSLPRFHNEAMHQYEKPVDWIRLLIGDCLGGDLYDPFVGGGSSIVACEQLGFNSYGIDIDPVSIAICLEKLQLMGSEINKVRNVIDL